MRYVLLTFVLLACAAHGDEFAWLEGEWVSDAATTMKANPQLDQIPEATRSKLRSLYGQLRWRFDRGTFEAIWPEGEPYASSYSLRGIDGERGELQMLERGEATTFHIWRTKGGFCAQLQAETPWHRTGLFPFVECFERFGS
jgi:hypothetical protein